ncbi:hypothetical protein [Succiniclasticum ruminis]|uniref:Uncharacterized protein n=1 Tax=Succiniclasticum ruminis DSM 9236 TaxID=1123323 RepID=A0A1I2BXS1_9FIRM|nr:hypothetical protein [Succiniclasticum ruminis]SFE60755.1 hypothetical protein SAMN05216245_11045 [Succiniclasticum ruminis DSM 9236]
MFRKLRYCKTGLVAGLIGMITGMAGQVYIYEFSDRSNVLMQAAVVFKELDELAFLVAMVSIIAFLYFCVMLEYRRWSRRKKRDTAVKD